MEGEDAMKVEMHEGLLVTEAVLRCLRKIRKPRLPEGTDVWVSAWSNCREQGYHIRAHRVGSMPSRAVCVAECRNSDEIVVVAGDASAFDFQTNQPNDFAWAHNRTSFRRGRYDEAARHIAGVLTGTVDVAVEMGESA
jgi:hypothetical protein